MIERQTYIIFFLKINSAWQGWGWLVHIPKAILLLLWKSHHQQKCPHTIKCITPTMLKIHMSWFHMSQRCLIKEKITTPASDTVNANNANNTHRHRCWQRRSHLDKLACQIVCHSFQVIGQQMHRDLKMWWTNRQMDGLTDRQMDEQVAGGIALSPWTWHRTKCGQTWIFKNVKKSLSVMLWPRPLTYDLEKVRAL